MSSEILAAMLAGGVVGYTLKKDGGKRVLQPMEWRDLLYRLSTEKPAIYDVLSLDAATARTKQEYALAGDFILIENYFSTVPFYLRLNEPDFPELNLGRHKSLAAPFYRFFITNVAGSGSIVLKICRGMRLEPQEFGIEELANRIIFDTPMSFDQRGQILWADDFEDNINKWEQTLVGTGAGGSIALSTDRARSGSKSAKLTTGDAVGDYARIQRRLPYSRVSRIGLEFSVSLGSDIDSIEFFLMLADGAEYCYGRFRFYPTGADVGIVEYYNSGGTFTTLDNLGGFLADACMFHTVKCVINFPDKKFHRLIVNERSYNMNQLDCYRFAQLVLPRVDICILAANAAVGNHSAYIDDVIITQNEP